MNAYFILEPRENGTFLRLIPASDGGDLLSVTEVMDYLNSKSVPFDMKTLNRAVMHMQEETVIQINDNVTLEQGEDYHLRISADKMKAEIRLYPSTPNGKPLTAEGLIADLRARNIRYGVKMSRIMEFFQNKEYCTDIVVAEGKQPRNGTDASIEYFFETDIHARPAVNEDGTVDFRNLNTINHCKAGDVLARLIEADPGEDGMSIYNEIIKPRTVKNLKLQFGKDIELSEDKLEIRSLVNGHVSLAGDRVFVSNVLELQNIDVATGNVFFEGNINIGGNVYDGFAVRASGNIEIKGYVEGATIEAGGDIVIACGMNGMNHGSLKAGGNIVCKFLENTNAFAKGYITTESILHCNVQAGEDVDVTSKKGFITGGKVVASKQVKVKTLGTELGASTAIEVGLNVEMKQEQTELRQRIRDLKKSIEQIEPILTALIMKKKTGVEMQNDQLEKIQKLAVMRMQQKEELNEKRERLSELEELMVECENPCVIVTGQVYPGTLINIIDVSMVVKSPMKYCKFIRLDGEVQMTAL